MINFLTAEYNKLFKRKNFYFGLTITILASLLNIIIMLITNPDINALTYTELQQLMLRFIGNKFVVILIIFMITVTLAGVNVSNVKNAITIGYTRLEIYFAKLILGVSIITILLFSSMISTFFCCGIWLYNLLNITAFWEALIRFALLYMVYIAIFSIALTLCYIINYNMLFAIIYFILFLVLSEIITTTSMYSKTIHDITNLFLTQQLDNIILSAHNVYLWPYVVGTTTGYTALTLILGALIINRKDIK